MKNLYPGDTILKIFKFEGFHFGDPSYSPCQGVHTWGVFISQAFHPREGLCWGGWFPTWVVALEKVPPSGVSL